MWIEQDADRAGPAPWDRARTSLTTCRLTSCERRQTARSWQPVPWNEGHLPSPSTSAGRAPAAEPFSFPSSWFLQPEFPDTVSGLQGEQLRHLHWADLLPAPHQSSTTHLCSSRKSHLTKQVLLGRAPESRGTQLRAAAEGQQPEPERCQTLSRPRSLPRSALCPLLWGAPAGGWQLPFPTARGWHQLHPEVCAGNVGFGPTFCPTRRGMAGCCPWPPVVHPGAHPPQALTGAGGWVLLGCPCPPALPVTGTRAGTGTSPPSRAPRAWQAKWLKTRNSHGRIQQFLPPDKSVNPS